jgi:NTE family protein
MPPQLKTFADLKMPLYVTAATLNSFSLYVWGADRSASLIDAVVASASMPVVFPPIVHRNHQYVDGGVIANLPLQVAVAKGATEIYALDVGLSTQNLPRARGILGILNRTIQVMLHHQTLRELEHVLALPGVTVHHIMLTGFKDLRWGDFSKTSEMIDQGYRQAQAYLRQPTPNLIRRDEDRPPPPPGAEEFIGQ